MERNIGDQLNKAYEAYRQASIEKDSAKKELQQMTEYYEQYTRQLQKQIEDQKQKILQLETQLISANPHTGEVKCEFTLKNQKEKTALPFNHLLDNTNSCRKKHYLEDNMETAIAPPQTLPVNSSIENRHVLQALEALQGNFQQIRTLTKRQKDHLKRFYRGNDMSIEQQFSMPIQCTDGTAERAERPVPSGVRKGLDPQAPPMPLASRGADPEDRDLEESLTKLSVKFPPSTDSEYEFLNSTSSVPPAGDEEMSRELTIQLSYSTSMSLPTSPSASRVQEGVRGPQQTLWNPLLCTGGAPPVSVEEPSLSQSSVPSNCAFCNAVVPTDHMNSHLYSHCEREAMN